MRNYIATYGVYVFAGFVVVFLATLAVLAVIKSKALPQTEVAQILPTPTIPSEEPQPTAATADYYAQLSFSLNATPTAALRATATPAQSMAATCIKLTAALSEGTAPLTVRFTASATKPETATSLSFVFAFGDGANQTIEKISQAGTTTETQEVSHTYTQSGNFTATVSIDDKICSATIAVGGLLAQNQKTTPTATPVLIAEVSETPIPLPKLPESGLFAPTAISILGGAVVILLAILL